MTVETQQDTGVVVVKVVVAGPFAAGKTTFISVLSEIPVLASESLVTDETSSIKANTTVAMDFGRITVPGTESDPAIELYLFGTPGQERFDYMWEIAARGMVGLILLVDVSSRDTWTEASRILSFFRAASNAPVVVGMNRFREGSEVADELADHLGMVGTSAFVPCQAAEKESAKEVLLHLLMTLAAEDVQLQPAEHS